VGVDVVGVGVDVDCGGCVVAGALTVTLRGGEFGVSRAPQFAE
jgi:hypothetical protein